MINILVFEKQVMFTESKETLLKHIGVIEAVDCNDRKKCNILQNVV